MLPIFKTGLTQAIAAAFTISAVIILPTTTRAHVTLEVNEAKAESTYKAVLRVGHGCHGEATQTLRVQIPEGVIAVKPMPKPGWTLTTVTGAYAKTYDYFGTPEKEGVKEIVWSGGSLPDAHYDEFVFRARLTGDVAEAGTVFFPTVQECASGAERWIEIPAKGEDPHKLKSPAPDLKIIQTQHHTQPVPASGQSYRLGDLVITAPWTRATPGGATIGGGYLKISNTGSQPDRFIGGTAGFAGHVEVHEMAIDGGIMRMRELEQGLEIGPGQTVELKPGGFHIMFMDLRQALKQGDSLKATLNFARAGQIEVVFRVGGLADKEAGENLHKH